MALPSTSPISKAKWYGAPARVLHVETAKQLETAETKHNLNQRRRHRRVYNPRHKHAWERREIDVARAHDQTCAQPQVYGVNVASH